MRTVLCVTITVLLLICTVSVISAGYAGDRPVASPLYKSQAECTDASLADFSGQPPTFGIEAWREWLWSKGLSFASGGHDVRVDYVASAIARTVAATNPARGQAAHGIPWEALARVDVPIQAAGVSGLLSVHESGCELLSGGMEAGPVQTEALSAMGANEWHAAGYLGQGVRVGVIDLGYAGYPDLLGVELPTQVVTRNFVDGQGDTDVNTGPRHGAAVAEIIHDVAPGAELYLAKILTTGDLVEAVDWFLGEGVQVINTSLGWYDVSPGDGTGFFADLVAQVRAEGVLWVTSAGDQRRRHWSGDWVEPQNGEAFWFGPTDRMNWLRTETGYEIRGGTAIELYLRWSDWENVDQDYDLQLWEYGIEDPVPRVVATGTASQTGLYGQTPTESLRFITTSAESYYAVVIKAFSVTRDIHLDLFLVGEPILDYRVAGQSLSNLADAAGAFSVGAVNWNAPYTHAPDSSEGPTKGPGGVAAGGLPQPGLSAYGGVSTASEGIFNGTSAAAPHVAGAAALVLSRFPDVGPDELEEWLYSRARDHGPLGWDPVYGYGSLYIGDTPPAPLQRLWLPLVAR